MDQTNVNSADDNQSTSNWNSSDVGDIRTITVSNVAHSATDQDLQEFFSYCGDVQYVERQRDAEKAGQAYVTFKDSQGAQTAMLLTGAIIAELTVAIALAENYQLPPNAVLLKTEETHPASKSNMAMKKAEDVVSSMLSKGYILGKDALAKAKAFDENHQLRTNASATASKVDSKLGLKEKLSVGTAAVNEKVKEMNERYQVSEKTRSALIAAEQKATVASSVIMSNRYVSSGASWVSNAFQKVAKAAEGVTLMTKEKVEKAEEEKKEHKEDREQADVVNEHAHIHLDKSPIVQDQGVPPNPSNTTTDHSVHADASPKGFQGVLSNATSTDHSIHVDTSSPPRVQANPTTDPPAIPSETSTDHSVHDDASVEGGIPANPSNMADDGVHVDASPGGEVLAHPPNNAGQSKTG